MAETKRSGLKDTQVVEAVAAAEPLLCTLMLRKLMILIQAATYTYQLALAELAAKVVQDLQLEAPEETLLQSLKLALVRQCVKLHALVA